MIDDREPPWLISALSGEAISQSNLAAQLRWLSRFYAIVPISEIVENIGDAKPRIAITFDDGFKDNLDNALPVLKALNLPATLFAVSNHIDSEHTFAHHRAARLIVESNPSLEGKTPKRQLRHFMTNEDYDVPVDERDRFMTSAELSSWAKQGFAVESHGQSHTPIAGLSEDQIKNELSASKDRLESICENKIQYFAFPIGKDEHMSRRDLIEAAGYKAAFSSIYASVSANTDRYAIPRICMRESLSRSRRFLRSLKD